MPVVLIWELLLVLRQATGLVNPVIAIVKGLLWGPNALTVIERKNPCMNPSMVYC